MASLASGTKTLVVMAPESTAYTSFDASGATIADKDIATAIVSTDANGVVNVNLTAHGFVTGDYITLTIDAGETVENGDLDGNSYYVRKFDDDNFKLYTDQRLRQLPDTINMGASYTGLALTGTNTATFVTLGDGYHTVRATERSVNLEKNLLESEEVRSSRMQRDVRHGFTTASASIGFEWVAGGHTQLIDSVLDNITDETLTSNSIEITSNHANNATGLDDIEVADGEAAVVSVGDLLVGFNAASGTITGAGVVLAIDETGDPDVITVSDVAIGRNSNGGSTAKFIVARKNEIGNGAFQTYTIERQFTDLNTPQYESFYGMVGNSLNVSISPEAITGGTVEFLGSGSDAMGATSKNPTLDPTPVSSEAPFAAFDGAIFRAYIDDSDVRQTEILAVVTSIEFTVNNNRTTEARVGSKFSPCVFDATCQVEGTMSVFFQNSSLYDMFVDEEEAEILIQLSGAGTAKTYAGIYFPRVKFTGGTIDPPQEGPVTMEMPFRALEGSNGESAIRISTFDSDVDIIEVDNA
jgi:hypothetical protein